MSEKLTTLKQLKTALAQVKSLIANVKAAAEAAFAELNGAKADKNHTHEAADVGALPLSGGTLTGNLKGVYLTGTWLQTLSSTHLNKASQRVAVLDDSGWIYHRTPAEILNDAGGAKKPLSGSVTIPTTGWGSDSTAGYPKYYNIAVSGVTENDRASVDIAPASLGAAVACGLCSVTETLDGKVRIRAASVPAEALTANYWIEKGA